MNIQRGKQGEIKGSKNAYYQRSALWNKREKRTSKRTESLFTTLLVLTLPPLYRFCSLFTLLTSFPSCSVCFI